MSALTWLWRGNVGEARAFLSSLKARSAKALADLLGYLDKHAGEIINYERRQQAGKPIGSGRMEKCVDQVVGWRQKGKGMSWIETGQPGACNAESGRTQRPMTAPWRIPESATGRKFFTAVVSSASC